MILKDLDDVVILTVETPGRVLKKRKSASRPLAWADGAERVVSPLPTPSLGQRRPAWPISLLLLEHQIERDPRHPSDSQRGSLSVVER